MARIRTIKPEFWSNEKLSELSIHAHIFAAGLINHCDDEGFFNANPKMIGILIFPLREDYRSTTVVLEELECIGFIRRYSGSDGRVYGHIINFKLHQVINKPTASKIKDLIGLPLDYRSTTVVLPAGSGSGSGRELEGDRNGKEETILLTSPEADPEKKNTKRKTLLASSFFSSQENETLNAKAVKEKVEKPDDVSEECWKYFLGHRRLKKALVTTRVIESIRSEANKASMTLEEALDTTVNKGWTSFNSEWIKNDANLKQQQQIDPFKGKKRI